MGTIYSKRRIHKDFMNIVCTMSLCTHNSRTLPLAHHTRTHESMPETSHPHQCEQHEIFNQQHTPEKKKKNVFPNRMKITYFLLIFFAALQTKFICTNITSSHFGHFPFWSNYFNLRHQICELRFGSMKNFWCAECKWSMENFLFFISVRLHCI